MSNLTPAASPRSKVLLALLAVSVAAAIEAVPLASASAASHEPIGAAFRNITWTTGAATRYRHIEAASVTLSNRIYVISGGTSDCTDGGSDPPTDRVDVYNTQTNSYFSGPSVNIARDQDPLAVAVGGHVYLIGGSYQCLGAYVRIVEDLDLSTNTWTMLGANAAIPAPLDGYSHCGTAVGTDIYYFQAAGIGIFHTTTKTWTVLPADPLLANRYFCEAVRKGPNDPLAKKARVFITGGNTVGSDSEEILVFKPATNKLTQLPVTTDPRAEHTMALLNGTLVMAGGDFAPTSVQLFSKGVLWNASALPQSSDDAVVGVYQGKIYILFGESAGNPNPHALIGTPV
jgi:hypothetical protein